MRIGLNVVYGASGAGKTFVVVDLACAVVRGVPWMGRRTKRGNVIYVCAEGAPLLRLEAYLKHNELDIRELDGLAVIEQSIDLLSEDGDLGELLVAIQTAIEERGWDSASLVVVDTLNRAMPGGNQRGTASCWASMPSPEAACFLVETRK